MQNAGTVKRRAALRKLQMIDAAAAVFAEKGFFGATTKDIADRLGMVQSAIYHYFASKEAALADVCLFGAEGFNQRLDEIIKSNQSASAKIRATVRNHLAPLHERLNHVLTYHNERHNLPSSARHDVGRLAHEYEAMVEDVFREGLANGEFRKSLDSHVATLVLLASCNAVTFYCKKAEEPINLEELGDSISDTLLHGYR